MKKNFTLKISIVVILIMLSIIFGRYNVNAAVTAENDVNLSDAIEKSDIQPSKTYEQEEKIIKYDAKTGKITEVNMEEIIEKITYYEQQVIKQVLM